MIMIKMDEKLGNYNICPFVGNREDAETAQLYPSELNCCNHAKPVVPINSEKQKRYCLTNRYNTCPIFLKGKIEKIPKEFARKGYTQNYKIIYQAILLIFVLVIAFLLIANSSGLIHVTLLDDLLGSRQNSPQIPIVTTVQTTPKFTLTSTQKPVPSKTPLILTPTQVQVHQLETPMGENNTFVIHKVVEGESFISLADKYKTTKEAIFALNNNLQPVLWANSLLVIPAGISDISGMPAFSIYVVYQEKETIEKLASAQAVDVTLLEKYNAYPNGYVIQKGEYVLIPHVKTGN
jgi:LysM repeat protein